jgi:hypothetical protein
LRKWVHCLSVALALVLAATLTATTPAAAISNGRPTGPEFGYTAALLVALVRDKDNELEPVDATAPGITAWAEVCSGVLIRPDRVATAGHCTAGIPDDYGVSIVGVSFSSDLTSIGTFDVEQGSYLLVEPNHEQPILGTMATMPGWRLSNAPNGDLGYVQLTRPVTDVVPVEVAGAGFLDLVKPKRLNHASFSVVGYGTSEPPEAAADVSMPVWTPTRKVATDGFVKLSRRSLHLARLRALGMSGACFGDSGGPILYRNGTRTVLVAVVSTGDGSCRAWTMGARVDLFSARSFLLGG